MELEQITAEVQDGILTVTLNRPERMNAWTETMAGELIEAFDRADEDDDVHAVIVTGEGRAFCAGADLERGGETFDWRAREASAASNPSINSRAMVGVKALRRSARFRVMVRTWASTS